ncbi:Acyl-CoA dehydrogenase apdG like protein [Verticillium longisporum]|nr:Acyl-CoA dehydrogenase apdG like protein [Verticillium longisporum]
MSVLSENIKTNWVFGSPLPFAEAPWARGCPSPYYKESHRRLRQAMRAWVDKHLLPHVQDWEIAATLPDGLYEQTAKDGLLMPMASGAKVHPEWKGKYPIIGGVPADEWDGFHDLIIHDEFGRIGGIGVENGLVGGVTLAVPALQKFGSEKLKKTVVHDILSGRARIALAITEPEAGSDVQGLQTEARLSDDGSHFIVNGQKKWITSGMYSNYFLALVKETTGDMTLLVIPRTEGLTTRHMTMSGSTAAGTAFVDLDDVRVPIDMVIGERGKGFKYIVSNFNHERLFIGFQALRCARVFKFANMSRETEALQSWIESLIYQLSQLAPAEADLLLAGTTAQLKAHSGIVLEHVVREAVQILGGIGLTRGGRGERVERIWRDVKAITVPGGSEEILLDLATRRALKISDELRQVTGKGVKSRM